MIEQMFDDYLKRNGVQAATGLTIYDFYNTPYDGAGYKHRSMRNWNPPPTSSRTALPQMDREKLGSRVKDGFRNNGMLRAIITRARSGAIAGGLQVMPAIAGEALGLSDEEVEELEETIDDEFAAWSENVSLNGNFTFGEEQELGMASLLVNGDCFVNTVFEKREGQIYSLRLQIIDAERISTPDGSWESLNLVHGIEFDAVGYPIAYWVRRANQNDVGLVGNEIYQWDRIPARGELTGRRRFLHIFKRDEEEQVRGVSFVAPIITLVRQLFEYTGAESDAALLQSLLTFFVYDEASPERYGPTPSDAQEKLRQEFTLGRGAMVQLGPGKKVEMANPLRPNQSFEQFVTTIMRLITSAVEIPLDEVLLRFETSYSSARASMEKAWTFYRCKGNFFARHFCQLIYELWFDEAVALGRLPHIRGYTDPFRRKLYTEADWLQQRAGAIDEEREVNAAQKRIRAGLSSIPREAGLLGLNWKKMQNQQRRAQRRAERLGLIIERLEEMEPLKLEG